MKSIRIEYILLMLIIFPLNAFGEDDAQAKALADLAKQHSEIKAAKEKTEEENISLRKDKEDLEAKLKNLQTENENKKKDLEEQKQKVTELTEAGKTLKGDKKSVADSLNKQIKQQEDSIKNLTNLFERQKQASAEKITELTQKREGEGVQSMDSLKKEIENLQEKNKELQSEKSKLLTSIAHNDSLLTQLEQFEVEYLAKLSNSFDADWANRPYSDMDEKNLDELALMCEKYKDRNSKIKESSKKFAALQSELRSINEANQLLNEPYDPQKATSCLDAMNKAMSSATSAHQKELTDATKNLKDYRIGILGFQTFIEMIDEEAAKTDNHEDSYKGVKKIIDEQDVNLNKVKKNPWLSVKYKEYLKELEKNCKQQGEARNTIMGLKTR